MITKRLSIFLLIIFVFMFISSCNSGVKESNLSEGTESVEVDQGENEEGMAQESVVETYPPEEVVETQQTESAAQSAETAGSTSESQTDYVEGRIRALSQNTGLLSESMDYVAERVPCVFDFIKNYDVCCLQEVFDYQDRLLDSWHKEINTSGKNNSLPKWHQDIYNSWPEWGLSYDALWYPLNSSFIKDVGENKNEIVMGVGLVDERPNDITSRIVFGPHYVLGPKSGALSRNGGLLILSKFPIILTSAFVFEKGAGFDALASKGVLYARIQTGPSEDDYVHVFNTHLQAHNSQEDKEARKSQVKELFQFVENCITYDINNPFSAEYDGKPVMIMGDFNIIADTPVNWGEKALINSPPQGETIDMSIEIKSDEYRMLIENVESTNNNLGINLIDLWNQAYPEHPGFTWIGKGWQTSEINPYGEPGNTLATESDTPQRIDYIFFYDGGLNSSYYLSVVPGERKYYYFGESNLQAGSCQTLTKDDWLRALTNKLSGTKGDYDYDRFSCTISDHLGLSLTYPWQ
jgi:endonuclease/exonuclease/phosphatase family metal-dependent hydrolase